MGPKRWKWFFLNLKQKTSPLSVSKKNRRLCTKLRWIEWYPSWPPLFWLDNIFQVYAETVFGPILDTVWELNTLRRAKRKSWVWEMHHASFFDWPAPSIHALGCTVHKLLLSKLITHPAQGIIKWFAQTIRNIRIKRNRYILCITHVCTEAEFINVQFRWGFWT